MDCRYIILNQQLQTLFVDKVIDKKCAEKILEYARRTIFGHLLLFMSCIQQKKQQDRVKPSQILLEVPQECFGLDDCKLINEDRPLSPEELALRAGTNASVRPEEAEDQEEILDPEDPLYGLNERLSQLAINEESKAVIKAKLLETNNKIKEKLLARQENMEQKIAA